MKKISNEKIENMFSLQKMNLFCIYLLIVLILVLIYHFVFRQVKENFKNSVYLYPTRDLQKICAEKGQLPAYGPQSCWKDGKYDPYANCECVDKNTGECKSCYPNIQNDERTSSVIYDATKF